MRFMVMIRANKQTEAGVMPDEQIVGAMMKFNEELVNAGVMLAGDGLQPSSKGARIAFSGGKYTLTDGPFPEAKELIAGFWMWKVKSKQEAIDWALRIPGGQDLSVNHFDGKFEIEIRQVFDVEDFDVSPELIAKEEELRKRTEQSKK